MKLSSIRKRLMSFVYAARGISEMMHFHANFKIQLFFACIACILGIVFKIQNLEWLIILLCIGIVLALETMNSAIEYLVDLYTTEKHPIAGKIKDLAAAAVLIFCIFAVIVGLIIFIPYFFEIRFS